MKKFLGIVLAALMLATVAFAADITVTLNGETVDCESYGSPATIVEGRTLVPLRADPGNSNGVYTKDKIVVVEK